MALPSLPRGWAFTLNADGSYQLDADGNYVLQQIVHIPGATLQNPRVPLWGLDQWGRPVSTQDL